MGGLGDAVGGAVTAVGGALETVSSLDIERRVQELPPLPQLPPLPPLPNPFQVAASRQRGTH